MFVCSVKTTRRELAAALGCLLLILTLTVAVLLPEKSVSVSVRAEDTGQQLTYLRSLGYRAEEMPLAIEEIRIPDTPDDTFNAYNALQQQAGFDLTEYGGQRVKRFCYRIADESGQTGTAHLYIWRGRLVGGDIQLEGKDTAPLQKRAVQED